MASKDPKKREVLVDDLLGRNGAFIRAAAISPARRGLAATRRPVFYPGPEPGFAGCAVAWGEIPLHLRRAFEYCKHLLLFPICRARVYRIEQL